MSNGDGATPLLHTPVDAEGIVVVDVPCLRCDYNLRGLPASGRCPECGEAVSESLRGELFRYCDLTWLVTIQTGVKIIGIAVGIGVGSVVGAVLATFLGAFWGIAFCGVTLWSAILFAAAGSLCLAEPDASAARERYSSRVILRIAAGVVFLCATFGLVVHVLLPFCAVAGAIGEVAKFRYVERLAMRIPSERLARKARLVRVVTLISLAVLLPGTLMASVSTTPGLQELGMGVAGIGGAAFLVFQLAQIPLMSGLMKAIHEQTGPAALRRSRGIE